MTKDRARLEAYLRNWRRAGVDYDRFDCVRLVTGWMELNGRPNPLDELPAYRSKAGALRVVKAQGPRLADVVTSFLGAPVRASEAGWGGIAAVSDPPLDCLGIIDGPDGVFLSPHGGLMRVRLTRCEYGWAI